MSEQELDQVTDIDVGDDDQQQSLELTTPDDASPTASDSDDQHEKKVEFSPEQQKVVNEIAAKKAFEAREAKRKAEDLEKRLAELEASKPVEPVPDVPQAPDPYDDDYEAKLQARDQAMLAKAKYDAQVQYQQQQQQVQMQEQQRLENERLMKSLEGYSARAKKLGISDSELQQAGGLVSQYGLSEQATLHILDDEQGPAITTYLSKNPQAMDAINGMPPMKAAIYIESTIKPEATKAQPKTTNAPEPVEPVQAGGIDANDQYSLTRGATFE
jgi:hypothetical protein